MQPAIDGKEERLDRQSTTLDAILAELRAIRARVEGFPEPVRPPTGTVALQEPAKLKPRR